ncbi:PIN domain-containing protein [Streptomyces sp. NPDC058469]|uniref:PIN domain-containing protein n=1 Tax=Streptomyces sp. NPDC058469 TaxID=3346514 RepID=UPI0036607EF5
MIILDANILKGVSLRGPEADLLRTIRASGVERVAAPWVVFEELAAQEALRYGQKYEAAAAAMATLRKASPWATVERPIRTPAARVRDYWRMRYADVAEQLNPSKTAYEQALFREANLIAPCKGVGNSDTKTGARDAAIWLTAVEYAREHPQETVYFVTNDGDFFSDSARTCLKPPLNEDVEDFGEDFVVFTSLDGVVSRFATEIEAPEDDVQSVLAKPPAGETVTRSLHRTDKRSFLATAVQAGQRLVTVPASGRFFNVLSVALRSVTDIRGWEIAGHKWYTATARWLFSGYLPTPQLDIPISLVSWAWETRVLVSSTAPEKGVTVLRGMALTPISPDDLPHLPPALSSGTTRDLENALARMYDGLSEANQLLARALTHLDLPQSTDLLALLEGLRRGDAAAKKIDEQLQEPRIPPGEDDR